MAEPPDLASLAKRYVDLWQDQLIAMAADPALAESTARILAALVPGAWPPQAGKPDDGTAASAAGAAAFGASLDERDDRLAQLARRLAALEKRLAAVEAGIRAPRRRTKPRAQSSRRKK